jgi:murein DD-endopeptidase MepM/ murein hydrolase activator NlpD
MEVKAMRSYLPQPRYRGRSFLRGLLIRLLAAALLLLLAWGLLKFNATGTWTAGGLQYLVTKKYNLSDLGGQLQKAGQKGWQAVTSGTKLAGSKLSGNGSRPQLPVTGSLVRGFGWYQDSSGWPRFNEGIDLKVQQKAAVHAVLSGRVESVRNDSALGTVVVVTHSGNRASLYGRLGQAAVAAGDSVKAGATLGHAADVYVHFEWRSGDSLTDPLQEVPGGS